MTQSPDPHRDRARAWATLVPQGRRFLVATLAFMILVPHLGRILPHAVAAQFVVLSVVGLTVWGLAILATTFVAPIRRLTSSARPVRKAKPTPWRSGTWDRDLDA